MSTFISGYVDLNKSTGSVTPLLCAMKNAYGGWLKINKDHGEHHQIRRMQCLNLKSHNRLP